MGKVALSLSPERLLLVDGIVVRIVFGGEPLRHRNQRQKRWTETLACFQPLIYVFRFQTIAAGGKDLIERNSEILIGEQR